MDKITLENSFNFFLGTLEEFGVNLLNASDEDVGYYVFEEFDGDSITFLHENTLNLLFEAQFIDEKIYVMSIELASKFRKLENSELWNVESVKTNKNWLEILTLSDNIKKLIKNKI